MTFEEFDFQDWSLFTVKQILWPFQYIWTLFIANNTIWLLTLQVEFTLKKKNLFLQRPDSDYSEKYGFSKRQNMSLLSVSLVSSFCFEIDPQSSQPSLWQYWLSRFQGRDMKLYTNFLVNMDSFYTNFTNTTHQKISIPHLTRIMLPFHNFFLHEC